MSNTGGVVRFLLFIAVILLAGTGYYAMRLKAENDQLHSTIATTTSARDALQMKINDLTHNLSDGDAKLKQAQDQVTDLQAKLEAATTKAPARRVRAH